MVNNYPLYRKYIKTGDCILWGGTNIISFLIKIITHSKVSHASLVLRLDQFAGTEQRLWILESIGKGTVLHLLSRRMEEHAGDIWWCGLKEKYDPVRDRIAEWALGEVGTPYDFGSIIKNILGKVSADASRLFCSEFVAMAYKYAGIRICCTKTPDETEIFKAPTPADLFNNYSEIFANKILIR